MSKDSERLARLWRDVHGKSVVDRDGIVVMVRDLRDEYYVCYADEENGARFYYEVTVRQKNMADEDSQVRMWLEDQIGGLVMVVELPGS